MQLNKSSWHYRVWSWTHTYPTPAATNLCSYVQRIVWLPMFYALVGGLFYTLVPACFYFIVVPIGLLFGYRPNVWSIDPLSMDRKLGQRAPTPMVPYSLAKIGWFTVKTWHLLIVAALVFIEWTLCYFNGTSRVLQNEGIFIAIVVAMCASAIFLASDTPSVFKAWLKAKKQGVCPLVTFTDGKIKNENQ